MAPVASNAAATSGIRTSARFFFMIRPPFLSVRPAQILLRNSAVDRIHFSRPTFSAIVAALSPQ
jgi:hypothetical protein